MDSKPWQLVVEARGRGAGQKRTTMVRPTWRELLEFGRWTASPHNIQPWRFRVVDEDHLEILYDPERLLPDTDPTGFFTLVGFGSLFENLDVAAQANGFAVRVRYDDVALNPSASGRPLLARAEIISANSTGQFARDLILQRRTSRLRYDDRPVQAAVLEGLHGIAADFGQTFNFSDDPELITWVLELNRDTLFYDMADPKARREVGSWIRYGMRQGRKKKDGLWSFCLGFPGWLLWAFVHARWFFEIPGIRQIVRRRYYRTTLGTRTIGWLSGKTNTRQEAVSTGRMLARLWLFMTQHGVYLHPFGSIITNQKAYGRLARRIRTEKADENVWLIVRLGHSDEPPRSLRLELDSLMEP